jgi:hypothetical protein
MDIQKERDMQPLTYQDLTITTIENFPTADLRKYWSAAWGVEAHQEMSRILLIKSLLYKIREAQGQGLTTDQQAKLDALVKAYKKNRQEGVSRENNLKSGTQLIREWQGKRHIVTVKDGLYEYNNKKYKSLSAVSFDITGTRWNGWVFFGIKNPNKEKAKK